MSRQIRKTKSKTKARMPRRGNGLMESDASLSRLSEKKAVFNSVGNPMSWRLPVPPPDQEYWCVTSTDTPTALTASASVETNFGLSFTIGGINAAELAGYQALFDQYRIRWIELQLIPRSNGANAAAAVNLGRLVTAIDFDSAAPVTLANVETYTNSMATSGGVAHYRAWQPCVTLGVGASTSSGANVTNLVVVRSPWLDLANTGTPHYGFKAAISVCDAAYIYDAFTRFHLAFRSKI